MAISPTEAGALTETDHVQLAEWERQIDMCLRQSVARGGNLTFGTRRMEHRHRVELTRRYKAVGWRVTHVCDQREGNFLEFAACQTTRGIGSGVD